MTAIEQEVELQGEPVEASERVEVSEVVKAENIRTYEEIVEQIRGITALLSKTAVSDTSAAQKDWYKHVVKAIDELTTVHEMEESWIQKYAVFHYLDKLPLVEKLVLVAGVPEDVERGVELLIKLYLDARRMTAEEDGEQREAILLSNGSKNFLHVKGSEGWEPASYTDEQLFAPVRATTFVIPKERIHRTEVGFMHPFKEKEVVFKMKDLTQKRNNTGAKCTDASKQAIASKIGIVLNKPTIYTATLIEKPELCVILEMMMRLKTESTGVYYFFGPEMANEMKLSTLHW